MQERSREFCKKVATGACFMGSGGGGPLSTAMNLIDNFDRDIQVRLYNYDHMQNMNPDELTAVVAIMGAPDAMLKLNCIDSAVSSFDCLNSIKNNAISYVIPGEIGPTSMIVPLLLASQENLGVIDADGVGRAVPSLTQCLFADHLISTNPTVIGNSKKQNLILTVKTPENVEDIGRGVLASDAFNQQGALSTWVMDKHTIPCDLIKGSVSLCYHIGNLLTPTGNNFDIDVFIKTINSLLNDREASVIFKGKLVNRSLMTKGGFDFGCVQFENHVKTTFTIYCQNENLIAWRSDQKHPAVIAPDSISYVSITGSPFTNADFTDNDMNKEFYIVKIDADNAVKKSSCINTSFKKALLNIGYGGKMPYGDDSIF